ncbi:hypothetical protein TNCV_4170521 [Trichonephila clavipes]|nr:hypothetical protein TNCV_4170521 [Trichonephila clavipes]
MEWTARSPDLHPIEHLWDYLGRQVTALSPHPRFLGDYTRAFGDGRRNFEPWSSDVDYTRADTPSLNYHTTPPGIRFSSRQI